MLEWHEELLCALPKAAPVPSDNTLTVVHSRSCSIIFSIYTESFPSAYHWPAIYLPIKKKTPSQPYHSLQLLPHFIALLSFPVGVTSPSPLLLYWTCFKSTETALVKIPADHQMAQSYGHFPSLTSPSVPSTVHSLTHRALSCNHLATWRKLEVLGVSMLPGAAISQWQMGQVYRCLQWGDSDQVCTASQKPPVGSSSVSQSENLLVSVPCRGFSAFPVSLP